MKQLTSMQEFLTTVHTTPRAIVKFTSNGCAPCRALTPILEQIEQENQIMAFDVNVDELPDAVEQFEVTCVPTTIVFFGGQEFARVEGLRPKEDMLKLISQF